MTDDGIAELGRHGEAALVAPWSEPLLTYSEQVAGAFKGLIQVAIPASESG